MAILGISHFNLKENGQKMVELWGGGRYGAGVLAFLGILVCGHLSQPRGEPPGTSYKPNPPISKRDMSTTTDAILDAIAAIDSAESGAKLSYRKAAETFKVDRTTFSRRHQDKARTNAEAHEEQMLLNPQQDKELVRYIQGLSERGIAPTRSMIKKIASEVSKWEASEAWVERSLRRNRDLLTSRYTTGIDRDRFKADTEHSYRTYLDLLHSKMRQYDVDVKNVYNMDEKGFLIGKTSRSKLVFSKQLWQQKKVTAALQDGNREWITILGCVCADGSWLDPGVIFEAKGTLRDEWLRAITRGTQGQLSAYTVISLLTLMYYDFYENVMFYTSAGLLNSECKG
jgi:hypothetical protein